MGVEVSISTCKQQYLAGATIEGTVTLYVSPVRTPTFTQRYSTRLNAVGLQLYDYI